MTPAVPAESVLAGGGTVIAATHGLARHLRRRHDLARAAAGDRAWPSADVLALDAWLQRTWETGSAGDGVVSARRLLSDAESRLVWRRVLAGARHDGPDTGVMVPLIAAAWRLCQSWSISSGDLRRAADSDDSRAFASWAEAYLRLLDEGQWIDSGGLFTALARSGAMLPRERGRVTGFAGFDPWTTALDGLADTLRASGAEVTRIVPPESGGTPVVVVARDEKDEVARAFAWAARRTAERASPDDAVAIIVPNLDREAGRVRRAGLEVLAPGWQLREPGVRPLALSVGRQLTEYPVVHCALELLRLVGTDVRFEQASQLLRSPYIAGAAAERAGRARAELRLRRRLAERLPLAALLSLAGRGAELLARHWSAAEALAAPLRARRLPPSQWAGHFTAWLAAAGWPGDRGLASEEFQAAEAWQLLLESFGGIDEVAGSLTLRAALSLLAEQARERPFEPESIPGVIQVLSPREAEGQTFGALWLCGLTADEWPPPSRPHALIPLVLQREAGIPEATAGGVEALTRRRLARLLGSAHEVVLSWPREQEQTETLPSPLLAGLDAFAAAETDPHPDRTAVAASATVETLSADPPPALQAAHPVPGGSRVLALQAVCPARAFVEFRLRGTPLEAPLRPLDAATRGRVVHRLLEELYSDEQCREGLGGLEPDALRHLFDAVVVRVLDEFLPANEPFLAGLRPLESARLWELLQSLRALDLERPGFRTVTELERRVSIGPLQLAIRLDRVDRLADGGELVIDYKTGEFQPSGWKRPRLPESQLPLYAVTGAGDPETPVRGIAVIQLRAPEAKLRGVGAASLAIRGVRAPEAFFRPESPDWSAVLGRWRQQLEQLAGEFAGGDFRVNPADRRWAVGQFAGLTRIHEFGPEDEADGGEATEEADE